MRNPRQPQLYGSHRGLLPGRRLQAKHIQPEKPFNLDEARRVRVGTLLVLFIIGFFSLGCRAFYLTIIKHQELVNQAEKIHSLEIKLPRPRGDILDRHGEVLATTVTVDSVWVDPTLVKDPARTSKALADVLQIGEVDIYRKCRSDTQFEWIKRFITNEESAALAALAPESLAGVRLRKETKRIYPRGALAANLLGWTDIDIKGREGLEATYEQSLVGEAGHLVSIKDAKGTQYLFSDNQVVGRKDGQTLRLTLDLHIQWFVEEALDKMVREFKPKHAWAIVVDVRTGEILAMATRPTFDPSRPGESADLDRRNRAVLDQYEPGSTMKPLTMAMVLADGKVRLDELVDCEYGQWHYGGKTISDTHKLGNATPAQIIKYSSNIGIAKLAIRMTYQQYYESLRRFGFGQRTGIDLAAEAAGSLKFYKTWYPIDAATKAYGQGIAVTGLQMLMATAALGNGGRMMTPFVVLEQISPDGIGSRKNNPTIAGRAVSAKIAKEVLKMMVEVTEDGGTGTRAAVTGFPIAGKTGTAFHYHPRTGQPDPSRRVVSFVGLVPGDEPILGILVVADEPPGRTYGGTVAAPAFREIAEKTLDYLGVYSEQRQDEATLVSELEKNIVYAAPENHGVTMDKRLFGADQAPDFRGLSIRAARSLAHRMTIDMTFEGSGVAIKQEPAPGQTLAENRQITGVFAPRQ